MNAQSIVLNEWISVEDQLPGKDVHMVLVIDNNSIHKPTALAKHVNDGWWIESQIDDIREMTPTHWILLPSPPE